jgi:hypothetical protein
MARGTRSTFRGMGETIERQLKEGTGTTCKTAIRVHVREMPLFSKVHSQSISAYYRSRVILCFVHAAFFARCLDDSRQKEIIFGRCGGAYQGTIGGCMGVATAKSKSKIPKPVSIPSGALVASVSALSRGLDPTINTPLMSSNEGTSQVNIHVKACPADRQMALLTKLV